MVIGICKLKIVMDQVFSLKEKRHILKSAIDRIKTRYNVSISEVELNDMHKVAIIGFCCISNESTHMNSIMDNVVNFLENDGRFEIVDISKEIIHLD